MTLVAPPLPQRQLAPQAGRSRRVITDLVTIKASAAETGGAYSLYEVTTPPGGGVPTHRQHLDDETLYVLDGRYTLLLGDETRELGPGAYAFIPRGTPHAYANSGLTPARLLVLVTPGGVHDEFLDDAGDDATRPAWQPNMAKVLAVAPKYGIDFHADPAAPTAPPTEPTDRAGGGHALAALRAALQGELITAASPDYDAARRVQDITVDRHPAAIVRAAGAADVAAAVRFARDQGYPLAVRSGGHSLARQSMIDGAVVVDLSRLKGIRIDPVSRIARVQPGVTSGDFAGPAQAHGLALSTGDTASVGFGGLTTGGGIGFMVRQHGLAIDNLLAAEVVTADGAIVTASPSEHPDLFWAIRGGGGNLGIVTELTFRLAAVGEILGGELLLPLSREAVRGYLDYSVKAPDGLSTIANLTHAPPAPHVPAAWVGRPVLSILVVWTGDRAEGEHALAPLRALATPTVDRIAPMPYPDIYAFTAHQALPHGAAIRSMFTDALSDATLDALIVALEQATSPYSLIHLRGLGGALARVDPHATAFAHRAHPYLVSIIGVWLDPAAPPAPHRDWTTALWEQIRHAGTGVYVNFLDDEGPARVRDAYPPATYARLAAIKRRYDPTNLFRHNQNITP